MKDKNFIIKVSDLLLEAGKIDSIEFKGKYSSQLSNVSKEGISGSLHLRSLNNESIYATLSNITGTLEETCDTCEVVYQRPVHIEEYSARFIIGEENRKLEQEHTDEEIFLIDAKNENIDVEDMIVQAIILHNPIVKHCPDCAKKIEEMPDDEENGEYFEATGNVVFH